MIVTLIYLETLSCESMVFILLMELYKLLLKAEAEAEVEAVHILRDHQDHQDHQDHVGYKDHLATQH